MEGIKQSLDESSKKMEESILKKIKSLKNPVEKLQLCLIN